MLEKYTNIVEKMMRKEKLSESELSFSLFSMCAFALLLLVFATAYIAVLDAENEDLKGVAKRCYESLSGIQYPEN